MTMFASAQLARAMHIDTDELSQLLMQHGIVPRNDCLNEAQTRQLMRILQEQSSNAEQQSQKNLEMVTDRYVLLIDTCSLLSPKCPGFLSHLIPLLKKKNKQLIVPSSVVAELTKLKKTRIDLSAQIHQLLFRLAALRRESLICVYGSNETFGDRQFLETAIHFMTNSELLVITQDRQLSMDLIEQNRLRSVQGHSIAVSRINSFGYLSRFHPVQNSSGSTPAPQKFQSVARLTPAPDSQELLPMDDMPGSGDPIHGSSGSIRKLGKKLASGGEGTVYELDDSSVAKLYHPKKLTVGRRDKLELMVRTPIDFPGICWPRELLYNHLGQLVGYRMDRASGVELKRCLFTRPALERHFPDWTKVDTVHLCVTILEKICALHRQGVILGDINPLNILVESPEKVWLVDCDSYQIGRYPCPVGTVTFTAPEIQQKPYTSFLRSMGNENFAVATLLFMIMLPGKSPYAQQGGESAVDVIRSMNFPYPCGENNSEHTPEGAWRFLWSHLPRYLKESFYDTFQKDACHSREETRLDAEKWLSAFRHYADLLEQHKMQDPESEKIFPSRWKALNPDSFKVYEQAICTECGQPFDITVGEREYLLQKNLSLPRRCPICRKLRKLGRAGYSISTEQ